jgi:hypothetical protein
MNNGADTQGEAIACGAYRPWWGDGLNEVCFKKEEKVPDPSHRGKKDKEELQLPLSEGMDWHSKGLCEVSDFECYFNGGTGKEEGRSMSREGESTT